MLYFIFNNCWSVLTLLNRTRRRQAREQNGKRAEHKEGLSSDDEETSTDITSYNLERGDQPNTPQCKITCTDYYLFLIKLFILLASRSHFKRVKEGF